MNLVSFVTAVSITLAYAIAAIFYYGFVDGLSVTAITWCFFIFATPVANASILLDLPLRLVTQLPMVHIQIYVYLFALFLVFYHIFAKSHLFDLHPHHRILYQMFTRPFSDYGLLLVVCAIGTVATLQIGDGFMDYIMAKKKMTRKEKHLFLIVCLCFVTYFILISRMV